ncbi:hypothetical protein CRG98_030770 [Punica granatum]|uniref:Uncharacterized protein n=1 Tax=Punica granatum TaxID=22663 RepID=A0A2I0IXT9_PUNGR|nr:hypothetical protein CRG98_030770 [Punica granatum]
MRTEQKNRTDRCGPAENGAKGQRQCNHHITYPISTFSLLLPGQKTPLLSSGDVSSGDWAMVRQAVGQGIKCSRLDSTRPVSVPPSNSLLLRPGLRGPPPAIFNLMLLSQNFAAQLCIALSSASTLQHPHHHDPSLLLFQRLGYNGALCYNIQ